MTDPATDEQIAELEALLLFMCDSVLAEDDSSYAHRASAIFPALLARLRAAETKAAECQAARLEAEEKLSDAETEAIPAGMPVSETQRLRAQTLSETVCDAIWGGEHAWESATDAEFEGLLSEAKSRLYGTEAERIRAEERERRKPIEDAMARALDVADRLIERSFGTDLDRLAPEWNEAYREVARLRTQGDPNETDAE